MMGFLFMKAVYEYAPYLNSRKKVLLLYPAFRFIRGVSLAKKPASQQRNTIKKYRRSDLIRCLPVMKLVPSDFAYRNSFSPRSVMLHVLRQTYQCDMCS